MVVVHCKILKQAIRLGGHQLGMRCAHQFRIVHGSLKPSNVVFDEDHCVHIVDFCSSRFQSTRDEMYKGSRAEEIENGKRADVFAFASIIFNILVDDTLSFDKDEQQRMTNGERPTIPEFVPMFVRETIEYGWSQDRFRKRSFEEIIAAMKKNNFEFAEGVDIFEVLDFVSSIDKS
jgi:serine/threonine protein kinase